jgi:WhiB family transcriptional regulator, redox-sensing transcriptional regulator
MGGAGPNAPSGAEAVGQRGNSITKTLAAQATAVWLMTDGGRELVTFADLLVRPERQTRAGCRGMSLNLFFPVRGESRATAKAVCASCEVRVECLDAATVDESTEGIWGGEGTKDRRQMRRGVAEMETALITAGGVIVAALLAAWIAGHYASLDLAVRRQLESTERFLDLVSVLDNRAPTESGLGKQIATAWLIASSDATTTS